MVDMRWEPYDGPHFGDRQFTCVICKSHVVETEHWSFNYMSVPPLCRWCEHSWGNSTNGTSGSFRDRRIANQIKALAVALEASSARVMHGSEPI